MDAFYQLLCVHRKYLQSIRFTISTQKFWPILLWHLQKPALLLDLL